jgi:hypothetical protein
MPSVIGRRAPVVTSRASSAAAPTNASPTRLTTVVDPRAGGAFFYKVQTAPNARVAGVRMQGTLPQVSFDPNRLTVAGLPKAALDAARPAPSTTAFYGALATWASADTARATSLLTALADPKSGPLDRPSVYSGGEVKGVHVDAGLSTDRVYDPNGRPTFTESASMSGGPAGATGVFALGGTAPNRVLLGPDGKAVARGDAQVVAALAERKLVPNYGFRPFWRVSPGAGWSNPRPIASQNPTGAGNEMFFPGEPLSMSLVATAPGRITMEVASGDRRGRYGFDAAGFGTGQPQAWKRVNSIDQFKEVVRDGAVSRAGNETDYSTTPVKVAQTIPTATTALGARWSATTTQLTDGSSKSVWALDSAPQLVRGAQWPRSAAGTAAFERTFRRVVTGQSERLDITPR